MRNITYYFGFAGILLILIAMALSGASSQKYDIGEFNGVVDSVSSYVISENPVSKCTYYVKEYDYNSTLENSEIAVNYINSIRKKYGRKAIIFDERAYDLAVARAKEMREGNYIGHVNPDGYCANSLKRVYGFDYSDYIAENIYGRMDYLESECTKVEIKPLNGVVDLWMKSRGHRYNLLYEGHNSGAVGCYKNICVFIGVNRDGFGSECTDAKEAASFWNNVPLIDGEVMLN